MQKIKNVLKGHRPGHNVDDEYEAHGATAYDSAYQSTGTVGASGVTTGYHGAAGSQSLAEVAAQQGTAGVSGGAAGYTAGTEGYTTATGTDEVVERPVGVGMTEVPVVVTEQQRMGRETGVGVERGVEEVCGQKTFTEVEDRPVVKERVERYVEHHPVEKQYVVETKYVGEREVASATGVTQVDAKEYVVEAAEPGPKCPTSAGAMMNEAMGGRTNI